MTSNQPDSTHPPFQPPNPDELNSQATRDTVLERLSEQQGTETEAVETTTTSVETDIANADIADTELEPDNTEQLANRQIGIVGRLPG